MGFIYLMEDPEELKERWEKNLNKKPSCEDKKQKKRQKVKKEKKNAITAIIFEISLLYSETQIGEKKSVALPLFLNVRKI